LESELAQRFNKISLRKIDNENEEFLGEINESIFDPVKIMESNMLNMTNISAIQPFNASRHDDTYNDFC